MNLIWDNYYTPSQSGVVQCFIESNVSIFELLFYSFEDKTEPN